jgi:hypothetical protein
VFIECNGYLKKIYVYYVQNFVYSPYDGTYGLWLLALQTYSELPPVLGSVHHPLSKCFVSFYDVVVFAFPLDESRTPCSRFSECQKVLLP